MDESPVRRPIIAALVVAVTVLVGAQPAVAAGGGANNVVQVHNRTDSAVQARGGLSVARVGGPTVGTENVALAQATCTDCRTVAAAVQVVLAWGEVTDYRPANAAVAVNGGCERCATFAYAHQVVVWADRPVALGGTAAQRIAALRAELASLVTSGASFADLEAQLDQLTAEVVEVVEGEVARAGAAATREDRRQADRGVA